MLSSQEPVICFDFSNDSVIWTRSNSFDDDDDDDDISECGEDNINMIACIKLLLLLLLLLDDESSFRVQSTRSTSFAK